jgi:hypothetical protein
MSARIAPEPANAALLSVADYRQRASTAAFASTPGTSPSEAALPNETPAANPDFLPPLPAPPAPPGTMFAAAVMAGALSPKPETPQEIFLRLGREWSPPDSPLRLADRVV